MTRPTSFSEPVTDDMAMRRFVNSNISSLYNTDRMALTETEFRTEADRSLDRLNRALGAVADRYDAEVMFQNGVLTIETEEPAPEKIVISPNAPVRQIWISALSRSYKLDWTGTDFALTATGEPLGKLVARLVGEQLGGVA